MSEQAQNLNENEELVEEVQQETTSTEDPLEEAIARRTIKSTSRRNL